MNNYITFNEDDKKVWMGLGAAIVIFIAIMAVFTSNSIFNYIERAFISVFEIFLPGYVIMKLFFDKVSFTDKPIVDRIIVSFGLSFATVQTLYFLSTYVRTYALNVDEDVISKNWIAIFMSLLVIGVSFGIKHYLIKKGVQMPETTVSSNTGGPDAQ